MKEVDGPACSALTGPAETRRAANREDGGFVHTDNAFTTLLVPARAELSACAMSALLGKDRRLCAPGSGTSNARLLIADGAPSITRWAAMLVPYGCA